MAEGNDKVKKLTIAQAILGVIVIGLGVYFLGGVYTGNKNIREVEQLPMTPKEELVEIQTEIEGLQQEGVPYSDPFNTDRMDVHDLTYVGRVKIPKLRVNESLVLGTSPEKLKVAVGILEGSDIPLGTEGESSIIAGQRGYIFRSDFFKDLDELEEGDTIEIELDSETLTYEVFSKREVQEDEVDTVQIEEDKTYIALVSSPPYWDNGERILVEAELVKE